MKQWKKDRVETEESRGQIILSDNVHESIRFLALQMMPEEKNWLTVKKHLLRSLHPDERRHFTTRDPVSKCHYPFNLFEEQVRNAWLCLTSNTLRMPPEKMMAGVDPKEYL